MYMVKRNLFGLEYDETTGKVTIDGEPPAVGADFAFENHPGYNPLQYATYETTEKLVDILSAKFRGVKFTAITTEIFGPLYVPPQNLILAERHGLEETFNAGLIANSLIRTGSFESFRQDLKIAGLLF